MSIPTPTNQIQNQDLVEDQSFDLEDLLPTIASRKANWYNSAFHNVTVMVGAGVLALPYAMSELGWGPGILVLTLSWVITLYTMWQMIEMHEMFEGQQFEMYYAAFGKKLGLYIIVPLQLLIETITCIVYMVTGGQSLKKVHELAVGGDNCTKMTIEHFILIFASSQFLLSHIKNFNSISGVSLVAAVLSVSYSTIAWIASLTKHVKGNVEYGYRKRTTSEPLAFVSALGVIAFAEPFVSYIIVAFCYFPMALVGYQTFGNGVEDNILESLHDPKGLIILANIFVVIHLLGSYQVYAMPVFDMIESVMIKKWHFRPRKALRYTIRYTFVAATMGIAVALPYFGALLSFFVGFVFAPSTYFIPCIMWLILKMPKRFSLSWCINWICIILGVLLMIAAPIGGLAKLIYHYQTDTLPNANCSAT